MKRVFFTLLFIMAIGLQALLAQSRTISGTVTSAEDGSPIMGASLLVKGTSVGTSTTVDGKFKITVPEGFKILVVRYIGMKLQEVELQNKSVYEIEMQSSSEDLDEVMVVAYGTTKKSSFTGAATSIKGESLVKLQSSNVAKSLEGTVAGVQIASTSGQPGAEASIRIRGIGSISAGQSPLIVVDGVPTDQSLNSIPAQDIETLTVLKDAAANSMYGARGSNGVILITTKKGEKGKTKINFDSRFGANSRCVPAYDVVTNPGDYYELTWESVRNNLMEKSGYSQYDANQYASKNLISEFLGYNNYKGIADDEVIDPSTGLLNSAATTQKWSDNWLSEPFTNGTRQEYNLNMSGGNENTTAYMSFGYLNDGGYIVNSDFTRISARAKVDQKWSENLTMGMNLSYAQTAMNSPIEYDGGTNYSNIFNFSQDMAPIYPIYAYDLGTGNAILDANGNKTYDFGSGLFENGIASTKTRAYAAEQNPLYTQNESINETTYDNLSTHGYAEWKFLKDFKFTANLSYEVRNSLSTEFTTPLAGDAKSSGGYGYKTATRNVTLNVNQLLNYTKKIGLHNINLLVGHESYSQDYDYLYGSKQNYYDPYNPEFSNAGTTSSLTSYTAQYKIEGYLSRVEYSYDEKYYASASFRRDGSSKFAPAVRWGDFWSVGGAWRVNSESFLADMDEINNLKIKTSYGTQGNDAISGSNLYLDQYTMVSDGTSASPVFSYRGSSTLTWEKSNNFNAGFEMQVFDRLTLNLDFFIKETKDMIYAKPLPPSMGSPTWILDNQIDMKNNGYDFDMDLALIKSNSIKWNLIFNGMIYKNTLTRLPSDKDPSGYRSGNYWREVGGSVYDWYLYEFAGVDQETGYSKWYMDDANGNKVTTTDYSEADLYKIGKSPFPDFVGGLGTTFNANGFDLSLQTAFQVGGYVYDGVYAGLMGGGDSYGSNWSKDVYKRWTANNTQTNVPRISAGDQDVNGTSDRFLTSASYFSLRNVTFGYTLPRKVLSKYDIQTLRIYFTSDNVWFKSARQGLDPRQSYTGITNSGIYSALRTTSVGVSLIF